MAPLKDNLAAIQARVSAAEARAGRPQGSVALMAVSKFQPPERIREAAQAGLRLFGESRLQEAEGKLGDLASLGEWHFIGHLQSNKAKSVAALFDVVQSVDSLKLAQKLSIAAVELGKTLRIYAQVNISAEPQKHGFAAEGAEAEILSLASLPGLKLEGLMGMARAVDQPEEARPDFKAAAALLKRLKLPLKLSLGMSHDFEVAIEEGSDLVRIGTALFQ